MLHPNHDVVGIFIAHHKTLLNGIAAVLFCAWGVWRLWNRKEINARREAEDAKMAIYNYSSSALESKMRAILSKIALRNGLDVEELQVKIRNEGVIARMPVNNLNNGTIIKMYCTNDTGSTTIDLWSGDNQKLIDILAVSQVEKEYTLRAMTKIRLRPYPITKKAA